MAAAGGYCALIYGGEHQVDQINAVKIALGRVKNAVKSRLYGAMKLANHNPGYIKALERVKNAV